MIDFINDKNLKVSSGKGFDLKKFKTDYDAGLKKESGKAQFEEIKAALSEWQDKLYAQDKFSLLLVFQAIDAAGKDGTIRSVMTGVNPQGCHVVSFKKPSTEELDHDYLWRCYKNLPERGKIGIFNRSYYEEVLVTRVHPEFIVNQRLPDVQSVSDVNNAFWANRFESIRNFEKHISDNGTVIIKFFLNVSKEVQKERFIDRIAEPAKNWKFSYYDLQERKLWNEYQHAYQQAIENTATEYAPWYVIPADSNWFRNLAVCGIIYETLKNMGLAYPELDEETLALLEKGKQELMNENNK
jgi:PPK2 family polyphosphate:nucleotide phosphotransferase